VRRAWGVLSVWQKLRLVWTLLHDILLGSVDEDMIEELLQADMLEVSE
jgi:pheromone shutdown protein TraB